MCQKALHHEFGESGEGGCVANAPASFFDCAYVSFNGADMLLVSIDV